MAVYIAVLLVVVLVLYMSYQALGAGTVIEPDDQRQLLVRLLGYTHARAQELGSALNEPADQPDTLPETAAGLRRRLSGYQQQLSRLEDGLDGELERARLELSRAIEALGWACRMVESGSFRVHTGVQRAVDALRADADACLARADAVFGPSLLRVEPGVESG